MEIVAKIFGEYFFFKILDTLIFKIAMKFLFIRFDLIVSNLYTIVLVLNSAKFIVLFIGICIFF